MENRSQSVFMSKLCNALHIHNNFSLSQNRKVEKDCVANLFVVISVRRGGNGRLVYIIDLMIQKKL